MGRHITGEMWAMAPCSPLTPMAQALQTLILFQAAAAGLLRVPELSCRIILYTALHSMAALEARARFSPLTLTALVLRLSINLLMGMEPFLLLDCCYVAPRYMERRFQAGLGMERYSVFRCRCRN